jgi:hypothetical protein
MRPARSPYNEIYSLRKSETFSSGLTGTLAKTGLPRRGGSSLSEGTEGFGASFRPPKSITVMTTMLPSSDTTTRSSFRSNVLPRTA